MEEGIQIMTDREALLAIRDSILSEAEVTVWMSGGIETVVDFIDAVIATSPAHAPEQPQAPNPHETAQPPPGRDTGRGGGCNYGVMP